MVRYQCTICKRYFSARSGLTQHANAVHQGRTSLSSSQPHHEIVQQRSRQSQEVVMPEHNPDLWSMPIRMRIPETETETILTSSTIPTENLPSQGYSNNMEDIVFEEPLENKENKDLENLTKESRYNLRSQVQDIKSENIDIVIEEPIEFKDNNTFDPEDLRGATLDDALDTISGKNKPERIAEWPNDAYRDFMNLIVEGNISNNIGDKIIKFFNKHSNLEKSPLPKSTKNGKDYLNQINSPSVEFKEKVVANYSGVDIKLYYRPIFRSIQALIQRPVVAENFVCKGAQKFSQNRTRIFGEQYECNWWLETEKTLPPLNNLLSIILYSDATTFDGLGKTSGHPVFLTLGNLPNWFRNSPESKVLLGFLPKVQDSGIKTTESFRSFQREIFHKCFTIMLRPLLEKPDALYFGIKGREIMFAARISCFLADMLEANEITVTYKVAHCKMPCHTCMVSRNDLNKIDMQASPLRTHENMQCVISDGQGKDFSVHSTENAFWKFP